MALAVECCAGGQRQQEGVLNPALVCGAISVWTSGAYLVVGVWSLLGLTGNNDV